MRSTSAEPSEFASFSIIIFIFFWRDCVTLTTRSTQHIYKCIHDSGERILYLVPGSTRTVPCTSRPVLLVDNYSYVTVVCFYRSIEGMVLCDNKY